MLKLLRSLFFRPPILQVATLCWRDNGAGTEILLIRSLDTNRWILPKGWPMRGKTLAQAAEIEAWEEAGVRGEIAAESIGYFTTEKRRGSGVKQPARVQVYSLRVTGISDEFPESHLRKSQWFSVAEALKKLSEPDLDALILSHFEQNR